MDLNFHLPHLNCSIAKFQLLLTKIRQVVVFDRLMVTKKGAANLTTPYSGLFCFFSIVDANNNCRTD